MPRMPVAPGRSGDGAAARRQLLALLAVLVAGCSGSGSTPGSSGGSSAASGTLVLATTTSTQDTGLLDTLVPAFEKSSDCTAKTVAVGSGEALEMGASGNADVLLVHSPAAEEKFMAAGHGVSRVPVMHNDFVLVGPPADPAHARQAANAVDAFTNIAAAQAPFVSRADQSGTNAKELALWQQAGITPSGSWYIETGQGMGETLTVAGQKQAYTLSDRGTYLATRNLDLDIVTQGGTELLNPYHVIVVKHPGTNRACATEFSDWLVTPETQALIGHFGVDRFGQPLFFPDAPK
jgi:tungstate transport system substrate-binding protein